MPLGRPPPVPLSQLSPASWLAFCTPDEVTRLHQQQQCTSAGDAIHPSPSPSPDVLFQQIIKCQNANGSWNMTVFESLKQVLGGIHPIEFVPKFMKNFHLVKLEM